MKNTVSKRICGNSDMEVTFFFPTLRRRICVNIFVVSEIYLTSNLPFLKVSFKGIKSIHNAVQPTSPYPFSELI